MPRSGADKETSDHYAARKKQIEAGEPSVWQTLKSHLPSFEWKTYTSNGPVGGAAGQANALKKGVLK